MKHGLNFSTIDASLVNFNQKNARNNDQYTCSELDVNLIYYDIGCFRIVTFDSAQFLTSKELKYKWVTRDEMRARHSIYLTDEEVKAVQSAKFDKICELYPQLKGLKLTIENDRVVVYPKNTTFE